MKHAAGRDVVDVWMLHISREPVGELARLLTTAERSHAGRFFHQRDRDRFITVRGWLRRLLGGYLGPSDSTFALEIGDQGKPAIVGQDGPDGVRFNVSHSGDLGLIAICRGREVGVDVEEIRHDFDVIELGRSCFSPDEHDGLCECPSDARIERFFELWTAKEACIKALGSGLSTPLRDFTVCVDPARDRWLVTAREITGSITEVRPLTVPPGYSGAVTACGTDWQLRERDVAEWER